ncbi:MAG: Rrf2 family transcriptional regulator [bacterium]|nr:Rrf2 family transcriptional regulator [bacterium]MBK8129949.1 Rrf2 family transcriptional regulator [bacterium]
MLISLQADYALRLLMFVARGHSEGKTFVTRDIAEQQHIPRVFLTKIVAYLSAEGLLETHRGKGGGIALARKPEEINMLEIIEAFEGSLAFNECTTDPHSCVRSQECTIRHVWREAEDNLRGFFRTRSLQDLLDIEKTQYFTQIQSIFQTSDNGATGDHPKPIPAVS